MDQPIISAQDIYFEYRNEEDGTAVPVLKGIDLAIHDGEFVAVLGHNGSGKSTFAKHCNAILLPTGGEMVVAGINTKDEDRLFDIRQNVGMVFQNPDNQIVATIVEEDVAFALENMGVEPSEIRRRVDEALKQVGMYEYREHAPHQLSGGQKQRVAIAGVMAMKPQCIVLDEPTAMLDPNGRKEVIKTVHELNRQEGITVLLITHYMEEVIDADRVIVMDGGKVVMDGTPREIFSRVKELKTYSLDVPQVTELADELKEAGMELPDGILTIDELVERLVPLLNGENRNGN